MRTPLFFVLMLLCLRSYAQQIEVAAQKGHSGDIIACSFNHDGRLLASAGADNLIKLWHIPTGKEMASFISASTTPVKALQFSSEDDFLLVKYADGSVHSWDIVSSGLRSSTEPSRVVTKDPLNYYTRDSLFQVFVDRFYLRKKDRRTGRITFSKVPVDISKNFRAVAVSEEHRTIVAANEDGKAYVYDLDKGRSVTVLDGHYAAVNSVCFAPDGKMFATAGADRSIIIWNTQGFQQVRRLFGRSFRFEALAFNHAGTQLAVGDELGRGRLIDLESSRVRVSVAPWHEQKVSALAFAANDSVIFSGGYDNRLVSFDVRSGKIIHKEVYKHYVSTGDLVLKKLKAYREPYAWINTVAVSPGGTWTACGGGWRESEVREQPQALQVRNLINGESYKLLAHQGAVNDICFLNDLQFLSAGADGLLQWHYDAALHQFYFRKKPTVLAGIEKILPGKGDTVLLQRGNALVLYDLRKEQMLDSIHAPAAIASVSFERNTGRLIYAVFNKLVFTDISGWHNARPVNKEAHTDKITGIAFNAAKRMIATSSWDATVKLWNADSGELLATIISIGSDDHLIITPDNYYYGTRNSLRGIGFKYGKQFISPEQYDLRFNRPDIVLARLGFVPKEVVRSFHRAYQKRLQKMNFTEQMLGEEIHLPETRANTDKLPLHTAEAQVAFDVVASDSKYDLDRINVFVNNIPLYGIQGIDLRGKGMKQITQSVSVALSAGKNKIQVSCLNEKGVESLLQTFEIDHRPAKVTRPRLHVAVVSVSNYANATMNLKYARKDGQDLVNMFRRSGWFDKITVDTLFDARATRDNILKLREKFMQTGVDDQVIFFVSGHGLLDDNLDFYFATHNVDFKNPASGGLRYEELEGLLDGIPARKKLLLMDACHSGEVDKSRITVSQSSTVLSKNQKGTITEYTYPADIQQEHYEIGITTSFELMQELFSNLSKGSGAVVISAAAGNSFALESDEWRNGVFTYALINGVKSRSADQNRNGEITVSELKDFISEEVQKLTNGAQKPTSRRENLEFDFRVW
ncbi:caspase family protein [Fulvivirgaceae bacterium PWU4]|uniref:Caspase family protein n=1 Tax=Chryseosolibacter histidini TaxID=2782349 RepID=A0AAP2DSF3_9BACT|nr:caspase family protein [Chryseosolibacter histidini]MBT1700182.1 caspase family protein [Chryseosolibacter histidini]